MEQLVEVHPEVRRLTITGPVSNQDLTSLVSLSELESLNLSKGPPKLDILKKPWMWRLREIGVYGEDYLYDLITNVTVHSIEPSTVALWFFSSTNLYIFIN